MKLKTASGGSHKNINPFFHADVLPLPHNKLSERNERKEIYILTMTVEKYDIPCAFCAPPTSRRRRRETPAFKK
jgi:hypothetical protein